MAEDLGALRVSLAAGTGEFEANLTRARQAVRKFSTDLNSQMGASAASLDKAALSIWSRRLYFLLKGGFSVNSFILPKELPNY